MEQNRVHPTQTIPAYVAVAASGSGVYTQLRRDWHNPQSPTRRVCVCLEEVVDTAWFGATHATTLAITQAAVQDISKEVSKQAREYVSLALLHLPSLHLASLHLASLSDVQLSDVVAQLRFNVIQERGWVLKPKPMQHCRRDAACKQLEETRKLEQHCAQRPPKTHSIIPSAISAFTPTELSFRSPLRLRAQISRERPDRDITSHLPVYIKTTAFA
jgi:hypothetical protein